MRARHPFVPAQYVFLLAAFSGIVACSGSASKKSNSIDSNNAIVDTGKSTSASFFIPDDYPVPGSLLDAISRKGAAALRISSGQTVSLDRVWFRNNSLGQILTIELYTDNFRTEFTHFYSDSVPPSLLERLSLLSGDTGVANLPLKQKDLPGFIRQAEPADAVFFTSVKGIQLGKPFAEILGIYGKPTRQVEEQGYTVAEWKFAGDQAGETGTAGNTLPLAKNSYGYHVTMYFKNGKLAAQVLHNDIP